jgi:hypothetical protein
MKRFISSIVVFGGLLAGCSLFGSNTPAEQYNDPYPNNGSYGADATTSIDAGNDADAEDSTAVVVEASTNECLVSCAALQCGTVPDQCGSYITCTPCRDTEECVNNFCRTKTPNCVAETDTAFCSRYSMACGTHTGLDNCGDTRTVLNCGACLAGICDTNNVCCVPETDLQLCTAHNKECGVIITITDKCGTIRTATCAPCTAPSTCNQLTNKCEAPDAGSDAAAPTG